MLSPEQGWPEGSQYTLLLSVSFWNCIWRRLKSDSKLGISSFPSILTATIQTYLFFILSYSSTQMSPTTVSFLPFMFHTTFKIIFLKHWYNQKFFIFFNTPPLLAGYDLNVSRFLALVLVLVCGGCFLLVLYLKKKKKSLYTLAQNSFLSVYGSLISWFISQPFLLPGYPRPSHTCLPFLNLFFPSGISSLPISVLKTLLISQGPALTSPWSYANSHLTSHSYSRSAPP